MDDSDKHGRTYPQAPGAQNSIRGRKKKIWTKHTWSLWPHTPSHFDLQSGMSARARATFQLISAGAACPRGEPARCPKSRASLPAGGCWIALIARIIRDKVGADDEIRLGGLKGSQREGRPFFEMKAYGSGNICTKAEIKEAIASMRPPIWAEATRSSRWEPASLRAVP
jgi:hypothetical protein